MRDLPPEIPDEIQIMIRERFGTMQKLADRAKVPYDTVRSVLVTGSSKAAGTLKKLGMYARNGGIGVGKALMYDDPVIRRERLVYECFGESIEGIAHGSGVSESCIYKLLSSSKNLQIANLTKVARALKISIEEWEYIYAMESADRELVDSAS